MDDTSVLETRFQNDTEEASLPAEVEEAAPQNEAKQHEQQQIDIAESFLTFVSCAIHSDIPLNDRLESMQLCHTLGEGASFTVKRHYRTKKRIIKVSRQSYSTDPERTFNKAAFSVLMKELHVLRHRPLRKCPKTVPVVALGWAIQSLEPLELCPSLYLEEAPHGTLADFEKSGVTVDSTMRRRLCLDVAYGIEALHACGVVHGDVKADNILIFDHPEGGYTAKISDFGCAVFLQKYAIVDPSTPVRLPGISKPWCAPEALNLVPIDQLVYTDIYSLGLLLFRVTVFCNPFHVFDLPVDGEPRMQYIAELLSLPRFPQLVAIFIEEHLEIKWTRAEQLGLTKVFSVALSKDPRERQLPTIIGLLKLLDEESPDLGQILSLVQKTEVGRSKALSTTSALSATETDIKSYTNGSSADAEIQKQPYDTARSPPEGLPILNFHPEIVLALPFEVRRQIQISLEIIYEHSVRRRSGRAQAHPYNTEQRESIYWTLFIFNLLGLGGYEPDVEKGMQTLYRAGTEDGGSFWKARSLLTPLQEALQVPFTHDQIEDIYNWTLQAMAMQGFTQRLLYSSIKKEHQNEVHAFSHGVSPGNLDHFGAMVASQMSGTKLEALEDCIVQGYDFGGENSLLHVAAIYGDLELVKTTTRCDRVSIDAKNGKSETPLMLACQYGHVSVAEHLLDKGSDASICIRESSVNALYWLSSFPKNDVPQIARRLVKAGASLHHIFLDNEKHLEIIQDGFLFHGRVSRSPLLRAIGNGDFTSSRVLLELSLETFGHKDRAMAIQLCFLQPMRLAALFHQHEILEMLCSHLEEVFKSFLSEESTLEWRSTEVGCFVQRVKSDAVACAALEMTHQVERLCIHRNKWQLAARNTLDVLVRYGLLRQDIVIVSRYGPSTRMDTLQECAANSNVTALEYLLQREEFSGLVNKVDTALADTTLIDVALDRFNLSVFKVLLAAGAELDLSRNPDPRHRLASNGSSYLHVCASNRIRNTEFATAILDAGVPAGVTNSAGLSALTLAIMKGNFPLAELLIERGASINTPGLYGYTTLGYILEPMVSAQCDSLVASVKYILALTGENEANFIVRQETGSTTLLLSSNAFHPAPPEVEVFHLLLAKFCLPEQINGRATAKPYSTPIQVAIANHNLPAVKALIKAGVDLSVPDHYGQDSMALAIASINKRMIKETNLARKDIENDLESAREIISVIAEQGNWPAQSKIGDIVSNILRDGGPIISLMRRLPHFQRQLLGLNGALTDIIDKYTNVLESLSGGLSERGSLTTMVELRRQLEQALKPIFFSEVMLDIRVVRDDDARSSVTSQEIKKSGVSGLTNLPILHNLTIKAFELLQQSAAFEFILDQIISGTSHPPHGSEGDDEIRAQSWANFFQKFAESHDQESLPYDWRFVRYPQSLLSWYEDPHLYKQLILRDEWDRQMIQRFTEILQRRADERARGERDLSGFDEEFRHFHFQLLHGSSLSLRRLAPVLAVACRCICMKPGQKLGDIKMEKIRYLDSVLGESLASFGEDTTFEAGGQLEIIEAALRVARSSWDELVKREKEENKAHDLGQPLDPKSYVLESMTERGLG